MSSLDAIEAENIQSSHRKKIGILNDIKVKLNKL